MKARMQQRKDNLGVYIYSMIEHDIPEVMQIEEQSFKHGWKEDDFLYYVEKGNLINIVAKLNKKVLGFMINEVYKKECHILNLAVHPKYRRIGIGGQMVTKLVNRLSRRLYTHITLEVCETNLVAQLFFQKQGFRAIKTLRNYYKDSKEDAYLMRCQIDGSETGALKTNKVRDYLDELL